MRDGRTRKLSREGGEDALEAFLSHYQAKLVSIAGPSAGQEYPLNHDVVVVGRGPSVDFAFDDPAMSRQHAAVEYSGNGFRVRDLGSTNGVLVNGMRVQVGELTDGDKFEVGGQVFQLVIVEVEPEPDVYDLSDEA